MKRLFNILVFCCLSLTAFSQEETRVVDSLLRVLDHQEGRDKVLTMIDEIDVNKTSELIEKSEKIRDLIS